MSAYSSSKYAVVKPIWESREEIFLAIQKHGKLRRFERKEVVFLQGVPADAVYAIESGLVEVGKINDTGREVTFSIRGPGETFGFSEIILGEVRTRNATVLEASSVRVLERRAFLDLMFGTPDVLFALLRSTLHRFTRSNDKRAELRGRSAIPRLAYTLVNIVHARSSAQPSIEPITLNLTHEEVGRLCDLSRQTVSSLLENLQESGVLKLGSRQIIVQELSTLEQLMEISQS